MGNVDLRKYGCNYIAHHYTKTPDGKVLDEYGYLQIPCTYKGKTFYVEEVCAKPAMNLRYEFPGNEAVKNAQNLLDLLLELMNWVFETRLKGTDIREYSWDTLKRWMMTTKDEPEDEDPTEAELAALVVPPDGSEDELCFVSTYANRLCNLLYNVVMDYLVS
ncbi:MAG: hypothetical protein ACI4CS_10150 [Candidatus Weimeria sp.]